MPLRMQGVEGEFVLEPSVWSTERRPNGDRSMPPYDR